MLLKYNFFAVLILALFVLIIHQKKEQRKSTFLFLSFLLLFFIHSLVDFNSVPDLQGYESSYKAASNASIRNCFVRGLVYPRFEVGFILLEKLCTFVSGDFRFFVLLYSFALLFFYYRTIKIFSPIIWLSVIALLLGPYNQSLYVVREHLAIAIIFFSYSFIIKRKVIPFLLLMFIAYYIHQSSLIFVPIYFLYGLEKKPLIIATVSMAVFLGATFDILFYSLDGSELIVGYESYLYREEGMNLNAVLVNGIFTIVFLFVCRKRIFEHGMYKLCAIIGTAGFIMSVVGMGFPGMGRLMMYYNFVIIIALPLTVVNIKNDVLRFVYISLFIAIRYYVSFIGVSSDNIQDVALINPFMS